MNISQPQNQISSLADLELLISQKKQLLATSEGELINIQKATIAENYTVRQLLKQKEDLENQITNLNENIVKINANVATITQEVSDLTISKEKLMEEIKTKSENQTIIDNNNISKSKELSDKEARLIEKENKLNSDINQFSSDKIILDNKINKIKTLISEIE